jgi:hypothetical protein
MQYRGAPVRPDIYILVIHRIAIHRHRVMQIITIPGETP